MEKKSFCCTRRGAKHKELNIPCQDASLVLERGGYTIAIAADGHGHRRHFRSGTGSKLACEAAGYVLGAYIDSGRLSDEPACMKSVKEQILWFWRELVMKDLAANPWSADEIRTLEEFRGESLFSDEEIFISYGSTLVAVAEGPDMWIALQIGDGAFLCIEQDGRYDLPMPESAVNAGNLTASICQPDAGDEFRHCSGRTKPLALLVYTDGIEKPFAQNEKALAGFAVWVLKDRLADHGNEKLEGMLDMLSEKNPAGDDVTIAGIVHIPDELPALYPGPTIKTAQRLQLESFLSEKESTLRYNIQKRRSLAADTEAAALLDEIIDRGLTEVNDLRGMLELPAYELPVYEEEPEFDADPAEQTAEYTSADDDDAMYDHEAAQPEEAEPAEDREVRMEVQALSRSEVPEAAGGLAVGIGAALNAAKHTLGQKAGALYGLFKKKEED